MMKRLKDTSLLKKKGRCLNLNIKELKKDFNNLTLYSAAMSFYTIFSLIPLILIVLSIFASSPFFNEFYEKIQNFITSNILPTNQDTIKEYLKTFLKNSENMGIIGGIYIIVTSILFFDNYETIISKIYGQEKRDLWEKIKLYWTMITLFPIMFSVAMYISLKVQLFLNQTSYTSGINIIKILPFFIIWATIFLAYKLTLINDKTKSTLLVSFIVTILFYILKNLFIYYVVFNKTYKSIYGSISIMMFLFIWIYINWIIYLGGVYLIKYIDNLLLKYTQKENTDN